MLWAVLPYVPASRVTASIWFMIIALAGFRMARFIVMDTGPWQCMARIRNRYAAYEVLHCVHCSALYTCAVAYLLYWLSSPISDGILVTLGAAGAVSLVWEALLLMRPYEPVLGQRKGEQ